MKFVYPPYKNHDSHRYKDHVNEAVNLDNVVSYKIGREAYYPDNEGIKTIEFTFIGNTRHQWYLNSEIDAIKIYNDLSSEGGE